MSFYANCLLVSCVLWPVSVWSQSLEQAREQHLQDLAAYFSQATYALAGHQVIELMADNQPFLALEVKQSTATPQGAVLIVHGLGQHPNGPTQVAQSRIFLPSQGFTTLSISLPLIEMSRLKTADAQANAEARANHLLSRLSAGVDRLNNQGIFNIVLLGFGEGAYWATRFLSEYSLPEDSAAGFSLILVDAQSQQTDFPNYLANIEYPILDLLQSHESWPRKQAAARQAVASRNQQSNYQLILDAPQAQQPDPTQLSRSVRRIWGWLKQNAAGQEKKATPPPGNSNL